MLISMIGKWMIGNGFDDASSMIGDSMIGNELDDASWSNTLDAQRGRRIHQTFVAAQKLVLVPLRNSQMLPWGSWVPIQSSLERRLQGLF